MKRKIICLLATSVICLILILTCGGTSTETIYRHRLNVQVTGWGEVTLSPDAEGYTDGTQITLTATPDIGWEISGWSGDASGAVNPLTVTMGSSDLNIEAIFELTDFNISTDVEPPQAGTVIFNPQQSSYHLNDIVTLIGESADGYFFDRWTGDTSSTSEILTLTVSENISLTANFIGSGPDSVTLVGTATWPGHTLSYPILVLFDLDFNIQAAFMLDGGLATTDIFVKFAIDDVPNSYIHVVDNLDNDYTIFENGEPWSCYDPDVDYYCNYIYYTSGEIIDDIDIELYSGALRGGDNSDSFGPFQLEH